MANLKNTDINDVNFLEIPNGSQGSRPTSPQDGYIFFNTTTDKFEVYSNGNWTSFSTTENLKGGSTSAFVTPLVDITNVNRNISFTRFDVFSVSPEINQGNFSVTNREITVPHTGAYKINVQIRYQLGSTNLNGGTVDYRPKVQFKIAYGNQLDSIRANQVYIRAGGGHEDSSVTQTQVKRLAAGTTIQLYFASGNDFYRRACDIIGNLSYISIQHLGA